MSNDELTPERFWEIMAAMPEPQPVFYRLYHDDQGQPLFYTMEDVPGTYIEITAEQYRDYDFRVQVQDGQLIKVSWTTTQKLERSDSGTPCHPDNVAVVVSMDQPHQCWSKQTYDHKN